MADSLAKELAAVGYEYQSGWEVMNSGRCYTAAVPVLVKWMPLIEDLREREGVVRALSVPWARSDEVRDAMIMQFQVPPVPGSAREQGLRWAVGNAVDVLWSDSRFDEFVALACDRRYGMARQMIVYGMRKSKHPGVGSVLVELLEDPDVDGHAASALHWVEDPDTRPALERMTKDPRTWMRRKAMRALGESALPISVDAMR